MSKKPVTLWRPDADEKHPPKGFYYCAVSMCIELVRDPGAKCAHHKPENVNIHRSPRNIISF